MSPYSRPLRIVWRPAAGVSPTLTKSKLRWGQEFEANTIDMSTPSPTSPPKRPRLSLQIRAIANGPTGRTSRTLAAAVDVKSPTSFNTLSNVYATAVDRSTPVQEKAPPTAINSRPSLRLQTQDSSSSSSSSSVGSKERRSQTPYLGPYLDTPVTAQPISPAIPKQVYFPSAMTATPPMSAQPPEREGARVFTFENQATTPNSVPASGRVPQSATGQPRRSKTLPTNNNMKLPYTHPRSLRSILRNSPLPPLSTRSPDSPRRQSLRLQEKAARRVAYNSPLEQTITTSKYTKSHIDLLADDATPTTPSASSDGEDLLDATMAYTGNETRDGGQTPGPFEEMRRRMAGLRASTPTASSPTSSGIRKRGKKKEKKRRWVWTIGQDGEDADEMGSPIGDPMDRSPEKKEVAAVPAVPVLPVTRSSVPVLAVPLPKPRTRMQAARTASTSQTVAAASSTAAAPSTTAMAVESPPIAQEQQPQPQTQDMPLSISTSAATISLNATTPEPQTAIRHRLPPIEPPTPSVESVASVSTNTTQADSVFDPSSSAGSFLSNTESDNGEGDVEMSDASSMFSDYCGDQYNNYTVKPFPKSDNTLNMGIDMDMGFGSTSDRGVDIDGDMDMHSNTPTTATITKPHVGFGGMHVQV